MSETANYSFRPKTLIFYSLVKFKMQPETCFNVVKETSKSVQ